MEIYLQCQSKAKTSTNYVKAKAATSWMRKRGKEIYTAFAVESQYELHRDRYVPTEQAAIKYSNPYLPGNEILLLIRLLVAYRNL